VDVLDILTLVLSLLENEDSKSFDAMLPLLEQELIFSQQKSLDLVSMNSTFFVRLLPCSDLSKRNPFVPVTISTPLLEAIEKLTADSLHRVAVLDDESNLVAILSQSTIVTFMYNHPGNIRMTLTLLIFIKGFGKLKQTKPLEISELDPVRLFQ
jgi:CBS domain-containing protein